jgi:hypothetical protein
MARFSSVDVDVEGACLGALFMKERFLTSLRNLILDS